MRLSDFDYDLPDDLVAQRPLPRREDARLLVLHRRTGAMVHDVMGNILSHMPARSLVVANNSRVVPARLLGHKPRSGGQVELLLLRQVGAGRFQALVRPLRKVREGESLVFPGGLTARLEDRAAGVVVFDRPDLSGALERAGHMPLPPYIRRPDDAADRKDYQTVYARVPGSVAAPTAGLHFSRTLMAALRSAGHDWATVTLHVGAGTFKPVESASVTDHPMHAEDYLIPARTLRRLREARVDGRPVMAVGTTSCRTLESWARTGVPEGSTRLFLYPGEVFRVTDALLTNFHLPRSTLLMLVAAFAGLDLVRAAYREAVRERYRFFSYGDAMLVV